VPGTEDDSGDTYDRPVSSVAERYQRFVDLHAGPGPFVMPNPWDAGSARLLESLGFPALATTSAGLAFATGVRDGTGALGRDDILANAATIVAATSLPVSADLEAGFGPSPDDCAATIRAAAAVGLVGGSIEDATGDPARPLYEHAQACERVAAAVEAAAGLSFVLTARTEGFLHGMPDLDVAIERLREFERLGADVLYAPGLPSLEAIREVCAAVTRPVNVVMGLLPQVWSVDELADAGVRRISVGGSLARAALGAVHRAAAEIRDHGTFTYAAGALPGAVAAQLTTGGATGA
jgi:2-methylisocitrate lyase-like PEP mutase family enzyme